MQANSYTATYESYRRYCSTVDAKPASYGQWYFLRDYVDQENYDKRQAKRQGEAR